MKELQVKAGLAEKGQLEKLDWMYEGPMATMQDHQNNTEQYLLGKEVELKAQDSEVKKVGGCGKGRTCVCYWRNRIQPTTDT